MMEILTVNGLFGHGEVSVDRLGALLDSHHHPWDDIRLTRRNPVTARFAWRTDCQAVISASDHGDVLICHSNGCLIGSKAAEKIAYRAIFLFRPAMSSLYSFKHVSADTDIFCIYHPDDAAIAWGARLLWHPFGKAGQLGFETPDHNRLVNLHSGPDASHNGDFSGKELNRWHEFTEDYLHRSSA